MRSQDKSVGCVDHDQCLQGPCKLDRQEPEFLGTPPRDPWHARVQRLRGDVALLRRAGVKVVVVTGSREWTDSQPVSQALHKLLEPGFSTLPDQVLRHPRQFLVVHGDARGLDRMAGVIALRMGMNVLDLPAPWKQYGKSAGGIRNQAMIDLMPDLVLGFPIGISTGTRDCLRRAMEANIATIVVES